LLALLDPLLGGAPLVIEPHHRPAVGLQIGRDEADARKQFPKVELDPPALTSQWIPSQRRFGQSSYASAIDNCLWDILGKTVGLPVYRLLGAYKDRVRAYASSQHLKTVDDFVSDLERAQRDGFTAYKIHPPWLSGNAVDCRLDIEVARVSARPRGTISRFFSTGWAVTHATKQ
jgi:L-alanine-DL-glutamate epimerase-like enolase superfamily enzyme